MIRLFSFVVLFVACSSHAFEERVFSSPQDEALFDTLVKELRCLVCQNQNIADSNAELAVDLRREIHTMISDGKTKPDIIDFMVQRYGEFVLYKPRFTTRTLVLWLAPALLLLLGGLIVWRSSVQARKPSTDVPDEESLERARSLLKED